MRFGSNYSFNRDLKEYKNTRLVAKSDMSNEQATQKNSSNILFYLALKISLQRLLEC